MLFFLMALLAMFSLALAAPQAIQAINATTSTTLQPSSISPVSALPTTNCVSDNFITPWVINNLVISGPSKPTPAYPTYVSFTFCDVNEDLVLTTTCVAEVADGDVEMSSGGYVGCEDPTVRFQLQDGNLLLVSRWYRDPCKGTPPYDSGIAYGQTGANFKVFSNEGGLMKFQQRMEMNVTRMS